jgi:sporulation protein YlmC with PRC-barrel domain
MNATQLLIGTDVRCTDGVCGRLRRLIVDPGDGGGNRLTHLAVRPAGLGGGRLVPADLVAMAGREIQLFCNTAGFEALEAAEETSQERSASWPYAGEEPGGRFPTGVEGIERDTGYGNRTFTRDRIPPGGVEIHRGEAVYATDGTVGRMQGLIVDLPDAHISHLVLSKGQLFDRKRIAVPVESVTNFGDGIQLDLTKEQVRALPDFPGAAPDGLHLP